jgi:ribose transport system permease protein
MSSIDVPQANPATSHPDSSRPRRARPAWLHHLSFTNMSVIYAEIALIIIFSLWAPHTFPSWTTVKSVLNGNAIAGLMALSLVVPLSGRIFDLSIGEALGLANMLIAWLLVDKNWGIVPAVVVTLLAGVGMGLFNALVVVKARIDSFIGTLATGALFATLATVLGDQSISGPKLNGSFADIATSGLGGIEVPVFLTLAVAVALWYFQKYTVTGRRIFALGFNERGSELVGIRTQRLKFAALLVSGTVAGIAGILLTSSVSSGTPGIGSPYLLNAYAAAFLGATQFGGRFNAWGTVPSVILLGTGTTGLYLVGGAAWTQSMFTGVVLLLALGASNLERAVQARSWIRAKARPNGPAGTPAA